ncbi:MAG: DUF202 domain-containing protein [Rhodanobacteraceae bacterium]
MPQRDDTGQEAMMQRLVDMSAERSYMNAERNLMVWIRTVLALMIFGIALDRFGLLLRRVPLPPIHERISPNAWSAWGGAALVALGVVMILIAGIRFLAYSRAYRRNYPLPRYHGPYVGFASAMLVAGFGIALLVILFVFTE